MRARAVHFHCCSLIDFQSFLSISGKAESEGREVGTRWKMFLIKNTCVNVAVFMLVMGKFSTKTLITEWEKFIFFLRAFKNMFAVSLACTKWVKCFNVINFISLKICWFNTFQACFTLYRKMNFFPSSIALKSFKFCHRLNNRCMNFTCRVDKGPCTFFSSPVVSSSYSWAWLVFLLLAVIVAYRRYGHQVLLAELTGCFKCSTEHTN